MTKTTDKNDKPRRGRPPARGVTATERFEMRITPDLLDRITAASERAGKSRAVWATEALEQALKTKPITLAEARTIKGELERVSEVVGEELGRVTDLVKDLGRRGVEARKAKR